MASPPTAASKPRGGERSRPFTTPCPTGRRSRQEKTISTTTLTLNGTAIDYDLRGDGGPPLLLVPGGAGHAGVLYRLAADLAGHYRVVAMSSRVASATRADTIEEEQHPQVHAEDTRALIEKVFDEPPTVFAFSSGAITTLELLVRHPEYVRLAVVHEPPVTTLLPDAARHQSTLEAVRAAARTDGPAAAAQAMTAAMTTPGTYATPTMLHHPGDWLDGYTDTRPEPPTPELLELFTRLADLQPLFLEYILVPFTSSELDLTALEAGRIPVVSAPAASERREAFSVESSAGRSHRYRGVYRDCRWRRCPGSGRSPYPSVRRCCSRFE